MYNGIQKQKYHWSDVSWIIKIKVKGKNIELIYNMVPYKLEVMYVEDDILELSRIIHNRNEYPK